MSSRRRCATIGSLSNEGGAMATMEIDHAVPTLPPHANLIEGPTNGRARP
jgi:hypothetical protein